jgi:hypothetical protein
MMTPNLLEDLHEVALQRIRVLKQLLPRDLDFVLLFTERDVHGRFLVYGDNPYWGVIRQCETIAPFIEYIVRHHPDPHSDLLGILNVVNNVRTTDNIYSSNDKLLDEEVAHE